MYCSKCGKLVDDNLKFCSNCGNEIEASKSVQPTEAKPRVPENYLIWAILSTLFCCWPVGIVSIVYALRVDSRFNQGDYEASLEASVKAKKWAWISAISAGVFWLLYLLFFVVLVALGISLS